MSHSEQPCCNVATGQIQNKSRTGITHGITVVGPPLSGRKRYRESYRNIRRQDHTWAHDMRGLMRDDRKHTANLRV